MARPRILLVGGIVATGAKKMSQAQAMQIEEHTGVPPEELEDDDLSEAMQELGIPDVEADPSELLRAHRCRWDRPTRAILCGLSAERKRRRRPSAPRPRYLVLGMHPATLADDGVPAMTRHDFEAWLDHHLDRPVLVEWRTLSGGEVTDKTSTTGVLRKDGGGEYHAGDAHIDLTDFDAADFGGEGVIVELLRESAELYIAVS